MSTVPRPHTAPALVAGCWALSVVAGAALLAVGPTAPRPEPDALSPYSLAAYLQRVADPGSHDVRVNGVYGSGHQGAWQFIAHLSWLDAAGDIRGGSTTLPELAGTAPLDSALDRERLHAEHTIGWTLPELDAALDELRGVSDPLAMLELEIAPDGGGEVISCHSATSGTATCQAASRGGDVRNLARETLTDTPGAGALSVRRA